MSIKCDSKTIRICSYKLRRSGRGAVLTMPQAWLEDNHIALGALLDVSVDREGRLIVMAAKKTRGVL